jgi:hypothetical protein
MNLKFYTDEYVFSHGKTPRGRGSWAFCPVSKAPRNDYLDHTFWSPSMTLSEAKKWLAAQVATTGYSHWVILP